VPLGNFLGTIAYTAGPNARALLSTQQVPVGKDLGPLGVASTAGQGRLSMESEQKCVRKCDQPS